MTSFRPYSLAEISVTEAGPFEILMRILEKRWYSRGYVVYLLFFVDSWELLFPYYRFPETKTTLRDILLASKCPIKC